MKTGQSRADHEGAVELLFGQDMAQAPGRRDFPCDSSRTKVDWSVHKLRILWC